MNERTLDTLKYIAIPMLIALFLMSFCISTLMW